MVPHEQAHPVRRRIQASNANQNHADDLIFKEMYITNAQKPFCHFVICTVIKN